MNVLKLEVILTSNSKPTTQQVIVYMDPAKRRCFFFLTLLYLPHRTRVHHPLSSPEASRGDGGLLHPVLCEGHHWAVDHATRWDEVSEARGTEV